VVNARLGYQHNAFDLYVYGENLANSRYRTFTGDNSTVAGFVYSIYGPPHTYGVGVTYQFGGNH
jgi:outer membrane receptor protein involved in Fe transport